MGSRRTGATNVGKIGNCRAARRPIHLAELGYRLSTHHNSSPQDQLDLDYSRKLPLHSDQPTIMEITDFVFKEREDLLLVGDYNAYRAHATRRLHKLRKKLGQATPKGRKYTAKPAVTPENVGTNVSYVFFFIYAVDI